MLVAVKKFILKKKNTFNFFSESDNSEDEEFKGTEKEKIESDNNSDNDENSETGFYLKNLNFEKID